MSRATSTAPTPDWSLEQELWRRNVKLVAGIDEAGRGALAGPVVAAAVILPPGEEHPFRDSKALSKEQREELAALVKRVALAYAVGVASALEVDSLNVLGATRLAALRALRALDPAPDGLVTDFLKLGTDLPELAVARGDARSYQIAAASILAKTHRDAHMCRLEERYPGYGFARHKGYGAPQHLAALESLGACAEHRTTFAPVARRALFATG